MKTTSVTIDIGQYRTDPEQRRWELPSWGHPLSQGVLPLFISHDDHLVPIGTAFTIGRGLCFAVSAAHNVREAWKREQRLNHLLFTEKLRASVELREAGFSLLHQRSTEGGIAFSFWPLETVEAAPPSDLVIGYPQFQSEFPTLVNRLSFDVPEIGRSVWSIGYTEMKPDRIPLADLSSGKFNLMRDYSHKLTVVEGTVQRIFTQKFASGFVEGACFAFDEEISPGQSGGPVMTTDGVVVGVNSATATAFFDQPTSVASLLYPMLFHQLRFGLTMGPVRMNASRPLIDLIAEGRIPTDGSEERIAVCRDDATGALSVSPRSPVATTQFVHDDFASFKAGRGATQQKKAIYRLRRVISEEDSGK